ncbi:SprT-like domain-containing protein [Enterobacter hormaechei]|uniref:SprT-like domain-containing protein n=1 Tax=Enterobacter hormaechei TaxID=158836 RepID=UPI00294A2467|nr:SprT-like domain-containing protein [Enterobacter hormaechei]MDV5717555.1 SprT-like domain-containing protein [Enterobacter hormaechei]
MTRATERAYSELQQAFDFYNQRLFDGELPDCLITFQRGKNTMGYFSYRRFVAADGSGRMIDEIALNPEYFPVYPLIEVMQTLVHEQCHMWQYHYGVLGIFRPKTTKCSGGPAVCGLQRGITFFEIPIWALFE